MALLTSRGRGAANCILKPMTGIHPSLIYTPLHGLRHKSTTTDTTKPPFNPNTPIEYTQPPNPTWKFGDGASSSSNTNANQQKKHISINPSDPTRPTSKNYKFLISSVVPRPIALISTKSTITGTKPDEKIGGGGGGGGGGGKLNLAPFSYFQVINHDPPMFIVSFIAPGSNRSSKSQKDTLRNLQETKKCVINILSEHMLQAANATAVIAEYGESEFDVSGLTPVYDTTTTTTTEVGVPRVKESIVSIEGRLLETREYESRAHPDRKGGKTTLAIIEGTRLWVREDAIDAEELAEVDLNVLRPVSRLGGDGYGRVTEVVEIERPVYRS